MTHSGKETRRRRPSKVIRQTGLSDLSIPAATTAGIRYGNAHRHNRIQKHTLYSIVIYLCSIVGAIKSVRLGHRNDVSPLHQMNENHARPNAQKRYEIAEDVLRSNIGDNTLPPGVVLLEGPIAEILQISRVPVQRALQTLESEGLVHRFNGRGYLVGPAGQGIEPNRTDIKTLGLTIHPAMPTKHFKAARPGNGSTTLSRRMSPAASSSVNIALSRSSLPTISTSAAPVVRDVLARLRERGLVRENQSSHWIAGPLTAQMIKDHYGLRGMLEPQALVAGANRVDRGTIERPVFAPHRSGAAGACRSPLGSRRRVRRFHRYLHPRNTE